MAGANIRPCLVEFRANLILLGGGSFGTLITGRGACDNPHARHARCRCLLKILPRHVFRTWDRTCQFNVVYRRCSLEHPEKQEYPDNENPPHISQTAVPTRYDRRTLKKMATRV